MLLVRIKEAVEGCWGKMKGFGDQGREVCRELGHVGYVRFVGGTKFGEGSGVRPLIGRTEIVVEG